MMGIDTITIKAWYFQIGVLCDLENQETADAVYKIRDKVLE